MHNINKRELSTPILTTIVGTNNPHFFLGVLDTNFETGMVTVTCDRGVKTALFTVPNNKSIIFLLSYSGARGGMYSVCYDATSISQIVQCPYVALDNTGNYQLSFSQSDQKVYFQVNNTSLDIQYKIVKMFT